MKSLAWLLLPLFMLSLFGARSAAAAPAEKWSLASRLYGDPKARGIGDLLTILIMEESSSSREANQKTGKKTDIKGSFSFFRPRVDNDPVAWTNVSMPAFGAEASRNYEGGGSANNQDQIKSTMTVRVMEVLPNGNLLVEGKRMLTVQGDDIGLLLSGTVRPVDIGRNNTVKSSAIGDLNVQYTSSGSLAKSQKKGIFGSLLDWVNPF